MLLPARSGASRPDGEPSGESPGDRPAPSAPATGSDAGPGRRRGPVIAALLAVVLVALGVRVLFLDRVSQDYTAFLSPWYDTLKAGGGFAAVGTEVANYNPPYLYLLAAVTYLPIPKIVAVKSISIVFDLVLAGFAAAVVRERFRRPAVWVSAFAVVLLAPTVVINSSWWGQCDAIYTAFCFGSLWFLIRRRPVWACVFFGLGFAFKLQAVFFLPVLVIAIVANRHRIASLLVSPAVFALSLVPAALAGRDWSSLLAVYPNQISSGGTGFGAGRVGGGGFGSRGDTAGTGAAGAPPAGAGTAPGTDGAGAARSGGTAFAGGRDAAGRSGSSTSYTQNAPTFYQWLGADAPTAWKWLGLALGAVIGAATAVFTWWQRRRLGAPELVVLTALLVLAIPFVLPEMHERYFYLADIASIVMAFYVRGYWPVAALVSGASLAGYAPFLWQSTPVPLGVAAVMELVAVLLTAWVAVDVLRGRDRWLRPVHALPVGPSTSTTGTTDDLGVEGSGGARTDRPGPAGGEPVWGR